MAIQLVVTHPFGSYKVGDHITDPALVAKIGATYPALVVKKLLEESESSPASPTPSASQASPTAPTLQPIR